MGAAMLEPLTFRGLLLSALRQPDVSRRCLDTFLRALQRDGSEKAAQTRLSGWGFGLARSSTRGSTEDTDNAKARAPSPARRDIIRERAAAAAMAAVAHAASRSSSNHG